MGLVEFVRSYLDEISLAHKGFSWERVPADGSRRIFYRLSNDHVSFIIMANPPRDEDVKRENYSYLKIGSHFHGKGIPVPAMYRYDLNHGWFIMEDLGRRNLQVVVLSSADYADLYKKVIELLIRIQLVCREGFDPGWCYHTQTYDRVVMERFESDYFRTYFLQGLLGHKEDLSYLRSCFEHLSYHASLAENDFVLYRDFQSRNLIVNSGRIGVVDWQGARLGPLQYDLASLLIDPYVELTEDDRMGLYDYYVDILEQHLPGSAAAFNRYYPYLALQRNLQILGAFSYLSKVQGKKQFIDYIEPALASLRRLLEECHEPELSPLRSLVVEIQEDEVLMGKLH
jgi:aminoglycoside/choline kinase family phosphotransferase